MLYLLERVFGKCNISTCRSLYITYIRPIIEYAGPVWDARLVGDRTSLENIQRRATRMAFGYQRPCYEDRLRMMQLPRFEDRRLRGDLIITYRALRGMFGVDLSHIYDLNTNQRLRGHEYKLYRENFHHAARENFLPNRVFHSWNRLPSVVVNSDSVNSFKNNIDRLSLPLYIL